MANPIILKHNLDPSKFMWLWSRYVDGFDEEKHCVNCLLPRVKKNHSKLNGATHPDLVKEGVMTFDEIEDFKAIYLCGVIKKGYPTTNYPHNLHVAMLPKEGASDSLQFEDWSFEITNGVFLPIPSEDELPEKYKSLPEEYTTCRIFRWAACYFNKSND